jgi:hypothetical protein
MKLPSFLETILGTILVILYFTGVRIMKFFRAQKRAFVELFTG